VRAHRRHQAEGLSRYRRQELAEIELLNPSLPHGQFAEVGYVAGADAGAMPGPDTVWTVEARRR
jgi:hypothetical protein